MGLRFGGVLGPLGRYRNVGRNASTRKGSAVGQYPTRKGVPFFGRHGRQSQRSARLDSQGLVGLAVYLEGDRVFGRGRGRGAVGPLGINRQIALHCRRAVKGLVAVLVHHPTRKGIPFFGGVVGQSNGRCAVGGNRRVHFAVYIKGDGIFRHFILSAGDKSKSGRYNQRQRKHNANDA